MFKSHFQTFDFDSSSSRTQRVTRLNALRQALHELAVDGFIVPRADTHQNEYVPARDERLAWLTGFTGSAGLALILPHQAAICVDGRYTLQAQEQIDHSYYEIIDVGHSSPEAWLSAHLTADMKLAYDPWLMTTQQLARYTSAAQRAGATLIALPHNPIDRLWHDQPAAPSSLVHIHPHKYAGATKDEKLQKLYAHLGNDALVVSDPHNVCWLFNIRGQDVAHTPLVLSYALLHKDQRPHLYLDAQQCDESTRAALLKDSDLRPRDAFMSDACTFAPQADHIMLDQSTCAHAIHTELEAHERKIKLGSDPITALKARKNKTEVRGTIKAHVRDGVALVNFLHWLDTHAGTKKLTEIDCVEALEHFRRATKKLKDISFPSISGFGANGASPHYRVTRASNARLTKGFYLIDSGAQYEDGTTDVTRTIAFGRPTAQMRAHYTRVLKGHIAIAQCIFPRGTSGAQIDALARAPLWAIGEDFDHGTGHGVGSYLSVHEGPQRISKYGTTPLEEGMILSNEPAYYQAGAYGIRLENLIVVEARPIPTGTRNMLGFKTLTLVPFDRASIDANLLSDDEYAWLNAYHAQVRTTLLPLLEKPQQIWLKKATQKI